MSSLFSVQGLYHALNILSTRHHAHSTNTVMDKQNWAKYTTKELHHGNGDWQTFSSSLLNSIPAVEVLELADLTSGCVSFFFFSLSLVSTVAWASFEAVCIH